MRTRHWVLDALVETLLAAAALTNVVAWILYRFVPPTDETRALVHLAVALGFTSWLVITRVERRVERRLRGGTPDHHHHHDEEEEAS